MKLIKQMVEEDVKRGVAIACFIFAWLCIASVMLIPIILLIGLVKVVF